MVLSLVPPKPQIFVFPHGLKNTSGTPALEWLRKTFVPPSSAVNTEISALKTVCLDFFDLLVTVTLALASIIMETFLNKIEIFIIRALR